MLSLWLIAQSPLMLGAHIPSLSPQMLALLTNPEAMAMNKQAVDGRQVERREDGYVAWVADVAGVAQARYVALFNISDQLMPLDVDVAALAGLEGKAVRTFGRAATAAAIPCCGPTPANSIWSIERMKFAFGRKLRRREPFRAPAVQGSGAHTKGGT